MADFILTIKMIDYIVEQDYVVNKSCEHCDDIIYGDCKSIKLLLMYNDFLKIEKVGVFCNSCSQPSDYIEKYNTK